MTTEIDATQNEAATPDVTTVEFMPAVGVWVRQQPDLKSQDCTVIREVIGGDGYWTREMPSIGPGEIVVDVGSHIGCFSHIWHKRAPFAKICCVEVCPENLPCLAKNVGDYATIINAACTYEPGEIRLANSIKAAGTATGGSTVLPAGADDPAFNPGFTHLYWDDRRPIRKVTLEEIMAELGTDHIDVLKLDCEGSEFSILEACSLSTLDRVAMIVGEYHGRDRWCYLMGEMGRFTFEENDVNGRGWTHRDLYGAGELGTFHLKNKLWWNADGSRADAGKRESVIGARSTPILEQQ